MIYKFIVKVIGEKRKFTLGVNLYLIMLSVLPGTIMMFVMVMIFNNITEQSNIYEDRGNNYYDYGYNINN